MGTPKERPASTPIAITKVPHADITLEDHYQQRYLVFERCLILNRTHASSSAPKPMRSRSSLTETDFIKKNLKEVAGQTTEETKKVSKGMLAIMLEKSVPSSPVPGDQGLQSSSLLGDSSSTVSLSSQASPQQGSPQGDPKEKVGSATYEDFEYMTSQNYHVVFQTNTATGRRTQKEH